MTISPHSTWIIWALMSAVFAALTAIFAKIGVANINSDLATFIRTVVILVVLAAILAARGLFQPLNSITPRTYLFSGSLRARHGRIMDLLFSCLAVGRRGARSARR